MSLRQQSNNTSSSTTTSPALPSSSRSHYTPAELFKKGIKRDPSAFPALKQQKYYQSWKQSFIGQLHAQNIAEIANPSYKPNDTVQAEYFQLVQNYMFAVFQSTLLTDRGREIVRDHSITRDAQAIFIALEAHANNSTDLH